MARYKRAPAVNFPTDLVFAAAQTAYRINKNQYVNVLPSPYETEMTFKDGKVPLYLNKTLMLNYVVDQSQITDEDRQLGTEARTHCQSIALKVLKEQKLSDFDQKMVELASADSIPDFNFGYIAYTPKMYAGVMARRQVEDVLYDCKNEYVADVGKKIKVTAKIIRATYSQKYNSYVMTGIDDQNRGLFFFRGTALEVGKTYTMSATVKRHADKYQTQLSFVRQPKEA